MIMMAIIKMLAQDFNTISLGLLLATVS